MTMVWAVLLLLIHYFFYKTSMKPTDKIPKINVVTLKIEFSFFEVLFLYTSDIITIANETAVIINKVTSNV